MRRIVDGPPIGFVIDVVNGWASAVRHDAPGPDGPAYPDRSNLGERWGVTVPTLDDLTITDWANLAYDVFAATAEGRLAAANRILTSLDLRPVLASHGLRWRCSDDQLMGALLGASLVRYSSERDPGLAHLGTCVGVRCCDAYVDQSQGSTRRYCSTRCQNRTKTYRRRGHT